MQLPVDARYVHYGTITSSVWNVWHSMVLCGFALLLLAGDIPPTYKNCTSARLSEVPETSISRDNKNSQPVQIVRCELQLPEGDLPEVHRAVRATEGRCWICTWCDKLPSSTVSFSGCPSNLGQWYSDSYTTTAAGCNFTNLDGYTTYQGHRVELVVRPKTAVQLADLKVCSLSAGCFDASYEDLKVKNAKRCVNGIC